MTVVPASTPVTKPEVDPTVAIPVELLVHVPPEMLLLSNKVALSQSCQILDEELMTGNGYTVIVLVDLFVQPKLFEIV